MSECSQLIRGNPHGQPLIFLHGFLGCKEDWLEMLPFFEKEYHCIALDLPGHGATPYNDAIQDTVKALLSRYTSPKPILVGYSMGGRIALQLADCAKALVLLSAHPGLKTEQEKEEQKKREEVWINKLHTLPFDTFLTEWYAQPLFHSPSADRRFYPPRRQLQEPRSLAKVMEQMSLASQKYRDTFACPALFLHGEYDEKYRNLYAKLPKDISVEKINHSGHACHLEQPRLCAHTILSASDSKQNGKRSRGN